jgi:uncharacterized protein YjbJ (UPF0337 family)
MDCNPFFPRHAGLYGISLSSEEITMSIKSSIKETAGAAEEELGEAVHNEKMAEKGRRMRNEGRVGNGKMPKVTKVGSEKP